MSDALKHIKRGSDEILTEDDLKKKLNKGIESLQKQEKSLQASEKKIIEQKKIISADEYKKKITEISASKKLYDFRKKNTKFIQNCHL